MVSVCTIFCEVGKELDLVSIPAEHLRKDVMGTSSDDVGGDQKSSAGIGGFEFSPGGPVGLESSYWTANTITMIYGTLTEVLKHVTGDT
jgi:hypothetical protein